MELKELFFILIVISCWGVTPLIEKTALRNTAPLDGLYIRTFSVFVIFTLYYVGIGRMSKLATISFKNVLLFTLSGMLAGLVGMVFYFKVLKINPASKVVPLAAVYPLLTAFLALYFLHEEVTWQRILGTMLIVTGILLIK